MNIDTLKTLLQQQHITNRQFTVLERIYSKRVFSLYYELKAILSLGVLLFATGVGVLIYLNIDTISNGVVILLLSTLMSICFWFVFGVKHPYSNEEVPSPGLPYDYALFLGCLLFTSVVGYVQYQYGVFGDRWELSALIPALIFFPVAYMFDHRGVLSLAITGLASWLGLTVSPIAIFKEGIIEEHDLIISGLVLGVVLISAGALLNYRGVKRHFTFTFFLFGSQFMFIPCLAALFNFENTWLYFLLLVALTVAGMLYAKREQSFFFVLMSAVYGYIGVTYLIGEKFFAMDPTLWLWYFIISGGLMMYGLFHYKRMFARAS
jgi:hypothetical protein